MCRLRQAPGDRYRRGGSLLVCRLQPPVPRTWETRSWVAVTPGCEYLPTVVSMVGTRATPTAPTPHDAGNWRPRHGSLDWSRTPEAQPRLGKASTAAALARHATPGVGGGESIAVIREGSPSAARRARPKMAAWARQPAAVPTHPAVTPRDDGRMAPGSALGVIRGGGAGQERAAVLVYLSVFVTASVPRRVTVTVHPQSPRLPNRSHDDLQSRRQAVRVRLPA